MYSYRMLTSICLSAFIKRREGKTDESSWNGIGHDQLEGGHDAYQPGRGLPCHRAGRFGRGGLCRKEGDNASDREEEELEVSAYKISDLPSRLPAAAPWFSTWSWEQAIRSRMQWSARLQREAGDRDTQSICSSSRLKRRGSPLLGLLVGSTN